MKTKFFVIFAIIISALLVSSCSWIWRQSEALGEYLPVSSSASRCKGNVYCGSRGDGGSSAPSSKMMPSPIPAPSASSNYQENYPKQYQNPQMMQPQQPQNYQQQAGYPSPYEAQPAAPQKSNFSYCPQCSQQMQNALSGQPQMQPQGAMAEQPFNPQQIGKINPESPY